MCDIGIPTRDISGYFYLGVSLCDIVTSTCDVSSYFISQFTLLYFNLWQEAKCVNVWHCDINTWRQQLFLSHIYFGQKNTLAFLITLRRRSPRETILLGHMNTSEKVPRLFTQWHIREHIDWYPFGHRNLLKISDILQRGHIYIHSFSL